MTSSQSKLKFLNLSLLMALPQICGATSFYPQPFPDVVKHTPVIVRGTIGNKTMDWGKDQDSSKQIYTYYELEVNEVLKGSPHGKTITIREIGGEKDGVGLQVAGTAQFTKGEDVVVLANEKNSEGNYGVQGLMMGKLNVQTDADGKEILTGPALTNQEGQGIYDENTPSGQAGLNQKKWTLKALKELIQTQANPSTSKQALSQTPMPMTVAPSPPAPIPAAAPQLQTLPTVDGNINESKTLWIMGVGIFSFAILILMKTLRRKK